MTFVTCVTYVNDLCIMQHNMYNITKLHIQVPVNSDYHNDVEQNRY